MTQLGSALRKAGYGTTEERLRDIATEVLGVHPNPDSTAAQEALYARVLDQADLLGLLFAPWRSAALKRCLIVTAERIREEAEEQPKKKARKDAPPPPSKPPHFTELVDLGRLTPASAMLAREKARVAARQAAMDAVGEVLTLNMLAEFKVDGTSIGDMTAGAALSWARRTGQHVRFVTLLAANLPQAEPIKKWIKPEEANELWRRSLAEGADA